MFPFIAEYLIKYLLAVWVGDICHFCVLLCAVQEGRGGFSAAWGCRCCLNFVLTSNICIHFLATMDLAFAFTSSLVVGTGVQFVSYINQDWFCPNGGKDYKPCPPWPMLNCVALGHLYSIFFSALLTLGCTVTMHDLSGPGSNVGFFRKSLSSFVRNHKKFYQNSDTSHVSNLYVERKCWHPNDHRDIQFRLYTSIGEMVANATGQPCNIVELLLADPRARYFKEGDLSYLMKNYKELLIAVLCRQLHDKNGNAKVLSEKARSIPGVDVAKMYAQNNIEDLKDMHGDEVSCKEDVTFKHLHALMCHRGGFTSGLMSTLSSKIYRLEDITEESRTIDITAKLQQLMTKYNQIKSSGGTIESLSGDEALVAFAKLSCLSTRMILKITCHYYQPS